MRGVLPEAVRRRPDKADLSHGLSHALRQNARCDVDLLLRQCEPDAAGFVDMAYLETLVGRFMARRTTGHEDVVLWRMLSLALWLTRNRRAVTAGAAGHAAALVWPRRGSSAGTAERRREMLKGKRPYAVPAATRIGTVSELTENCNLPLNSDILGGAANTSCPPGVPGS